MLSTSSTTITHESHEETQETIRTVLINDFDNPLQMGSYRIARSKVPSTTSTDLESIDKQSSNLFHTLLNSNKWLMRLYLLIVAILTHKYTKRAFVVIAAILICILRIMNEICDFAQMEREHREFKERYTRQMQEIDTDQVNNIDHNITNEHVEELSTDQDKESTDFISDVEKPAVIETDEYTPAINKQNEEKPQVNMVMQKGRAYFDLSKNTIHIYERVVDSDSSDTHEHKGELYIKDQENILQMVKQKKLLSEENGMIGGDENKIEEANRAEKVADINPPSNYDTGMIGGDENKIEDANKAEEVADTKPPSNDDTGMISQQPRTAHVDEAKSHASVEAGDHEKPKKANKFNLKRDNPALKYIELGDFKPEMLANPRADTKVMEYRNTNMVVAEGVMWKKREFFACFWHKKYFCLLKNGFLVYHKLDGSRFSKGNWNLAETNVVRQMAVGQTHPHRLVLDGGQFFAFDEKVERDYWYIRILEVQEAIRDDTMKRKKR